MKRIFFLLFTISGLLFMKGLHATTVEKLGIEKGLSNNNVVSITQDRNGFIWICTKDGLDRFDSNAFKIFRTSDTDTNSICSNVLNYIYADKLDNIIWIASEKNGVDAYNYETQIFTHYEHDYHNPETNDLSANGITHIDDDPDGNIWFATYDGGIDFLDRKTMRFTNYNTHNTPGLGSNYNWCVLYDSAERVYAGHVVDGFSIINLKNNTAENFRHDPNKPNSLADNTVTNILKDSKDRVWIGTRNGLSLFNPETKHIINLKNDPSNPNSLSNNFIQFIIESKDHKIYIGTEGGGLNILNPEDLTFSSSPSTVKFEHILAAETSEGLSSLSVQTVFQDSFGNFWLGGLGGGLNFIPKQEPYFKRIEYLPLIGNHNSLNNKNVPDMCVVNGEQLWVASGEGGISVYEAGKKMTDIRTTNNQREYLRPSALFYDTNENIWIGNFDGRIYRYNLQSKHFEKLTCFEHLDNIPVYHLLIDSRQNLWLVTDIGLYSYHIPTRTVNFYTISNSDLMDNNVRAIAEDANGNIWVGALGGGLCVYDDSFNLIHDFGRELPFYSVTNIYRDSKNRMWVGSQNDLYLFKNYAIGDMVRIGTESGLAENSIRAVVEGKTADEIWISTTTGISHIDLNTMHISNFDVSDNILLGDYLSGSVAKTANGNIHFGSQNGITWFNQQIEQTNTANPMASFTSFAITDKKNYLNQFSEIPYQNEIKLKHHQNSVQIKFNVLDYFLAKKVEFIYQMKGIDDDWFLVNTANEVTFRNLKPGNYVFNLKTRIQNNDWPDTLSSLSFTIRPPLWLTWWMKLIYLLLSSLIILFVARFYKNKLKIENDLVLEKKSRQQEHSLNEERLRFFTNITHELRSPLTLILGPVEDLISDDNLNPEQSKKVHLIQRIANRLLQSVNQILEFRKSENKKRRLSVVKDDFRNFIIESGEKFKNQNQNIDFIINVSDEKIEMFYDPEVVSMIVDNLLSNAFKYTAEGSISLDLNQINEDNINYTQLVVSDTGFGIAEEDLPYVFDRYYQAKNSAHPVKGTGIGLALVKNMIELHEAEISVSSKLKEGSVFTVRFLSDNSYPEAIHYDPEETQMEETEENSQSVILLVDDDPDIIEYITDSLRDTYKILSANNGKAGLKTALAETPDIIISDVMMPIMDGIEMCRQIKQDVRSSHIPLILLTAKDTLHDQKVGYDAGADSYLTKPFSSNLLKSRIKNIIDSRQKYALSNASEFKQKQELLNESIGELDKEFLHQLTKVIEENLEDEEMNISYVAARLNMSHSTLYRKIKALTNLTANEFIRKVRINYAEQLLITGQYNISEIMYQVGINSSSYFRQCFKDEFGMNPSEYLTKLKES